MLELDLTAFFPGFVIGVVLYWLGVWLSRALKFRCRYCGKPTRGRDYDGKFICSDCFLSEIHNDNYHS